MKKKIIKPTKAPAAEEISLTPEQVNKFNQLQEIDKLIGIVYDFEDLQYFIGKVMKMFAGVPIEDKIAKIQLAAVVPIFTAIPLPNEIPFELVERIAKSTINEFTRYLTNIQAQMVAIKEQQNNLKKVENEPTKTKSAS